MAELGDDVLPAVRHVHQRWYQECWPIYEYSAGRPEAAEACLEAAYAAVCRAIEQDFFLVLLANHCQEFRLHQARIARSRNHRPDVARYIGEAARMIEGKAPLCELADGRAIHLGDMEAFCASLPRPAGSPPYLADLFDRAEHRRLFESFVQGIYIVPGFVITYP